VRQEKEADITVVIGNPPYNVGQKNQNDNNKNRPYPIIDQRIRETYARDSQASNKNALSDAYVKFFRWASDRLGKRDGIVCFVTNNSFVDQIAFDGMRKHLQKDFTHIYHLDLHGNVRKNPKLSGTTHNIFGIQVGVGITIAVRNSRNSMPKLYYYRVPEYWRKADKLAFLREKKNIAGIEWQELQADERYTWITDGLQSEFAQFLPLGRKQAKNNAGEDLTVVFKNYGRGVATCRDDWAYNFNQDTLREKIKLLINTYNSQVDQWKRREDSSLKVDDFLSYDDTKIKWSRDLKLDLQRGHYASFSDEKVRASLYRPFCKRYLFFDRILNEEVYQFPQILPTTLTETENSIICLSGIGSNKPFHCLAVHIIPCLDILEKTQCFPFYTYAEDGTNRRENITDWALQQFQTRYGEQVTKWDIFHYTYAILHHPQYRERYAENLKRDLPHIPLVTTRASFDACVSIGKALMDLHLNYERQAEYKLDWQENKQVPFSWRVEKMRLTPDKTAIIVNDSLTLAGLPPECFLYRLGNRSALEWVLDQYQLSTEKRSDIVSDPNKPDDEEYVVRLVGKVITVSVETVRLVDRLAETVTGQEWLEEAVEVE
jgi:predicted helicase